MQKSFLFALCLLVWQSAKAQVNPVPTPRHRFMVIAHRGDHVVYPENTLEGYAEAIKNEADYIEIDVRTTKDGQLVSMHDGTVDRMTNGKGAVKDLTLAEIEQLHIKSKDTGDRKTYLVPTFDQILKLCKDKMYIYIDFKQADPALTYAMLKKYGMEKQVLVYINAKRQFIDWRKVDPTMPLMLSLPDSVKTVAGIRQFIDTVKPDLLDGNWKEYTSEMVSAAKDMQLPVWPDVQSRDENTIWEEALAKGFNGLQTDHPAALVKFLKEKSLR